MNEVVLNPFGEVATQTHGNAVANSDQQRAIAEVQAAMMIARMNPRNQIAAMDRILNSCTRPSLANAAVYTYGKGGSEVSGPSIKLAETMAQQWGNIKFGFSELSRGVNPDGSGYSEVKAFAWDLETNTERPLQFRVRHWIDSKSGGRKTRDEREIYELVANMAQRRVRACILSIIPGDVTEAAVTQCDVTMKATADISPEATQKLVAAFSQFGVTKEHLEVRIQRRLDSIQPAQVISLRKIYASLRDEMSAPGDWFDMGEQAAPATGASGLKSSVAAKKAAPAEPAKASAPAEVDQETGEVTEGAGADQDFLDGMDGRREPEPAATTRRARRERAAATME